MFALLCGAAAAVTDQAAVLNELYASTNGGAWSDSTGWAAGSDACPVRCWLQRGQRRVHAHALRRCYLVVAASVVLAAPLLLVLLWVVVVLLLLMRCSGSSPSSRTASIHQWCP
jgi:hypothetical protein